MKALKALDEVAYVRYASVYRDFRETQDFALPQAEIGRQIEPLATLLPSPGEGEEGGATSGIRTHDPLSPRRVRYQAALRSVARRDSTARRRRLAPAEAAASSGPGITLSLLPDHAPPLAACSGRADGRNT